MAEEGNIDINVNFNDAQQSAQKLTQVASALGQVDQQADATQASTAQVGTNFTQMAQSGQQLTQKIQGAASAVQGLVSALGSHDRTAGLIASTAGSVAQFAALGSMLGPAGTLIGGIVGATAAMVGFANETRRLSEEAQNATEDVITMVEAMESAAHTSRINMAVADANEYAEEIDRITAALEENRLAHEELLSADSFSVGHLDALNREAAALHSTLADVRELSEIAQRESVAVMIEDLREAPSSGRNPRRRGGGGTSPADEAMARLEASEAEVAERQAEVDELRLEKAEELKAGLLEIERKRLEEEAAMEEEALALAERLKAEELEMAESHAAKMLEIEQERHEAEKAAQQDALEEREQQWGEVTGMLGDVTSALGDTLKDIATGEKTAEEAFKGLAAAFLEMISEYATLKAATEFADAGASFARYDYAGGAAHIGAGVAFTAVAVATGIGAAAINQAPNAPARPEAGQQPTAGGRSGDVVLNFNSPVVTSGTRAELGREWRTMVAEADGI